MSYSDVQDEIVAKLKTIPGVDVHESVMSDNVQALIKSTGQMKPFLAVDFGALVNSHRKGTTGIVGAAYNTYEGNAIVHSVASDGRTARRVIQSVVDVLLGFVPNNCGEMVPETYGGVGATSVMVAPSRYSQVQPFVFLVNSSKPQ